MCVCVTHCLTCTHAVHYTFMSTEHPYEPGTPQYQWLQNDLMKANANRANVPWLILTGMV